MKYKCLIVDHDDTAVNSTATVHYPCFIQYCGEFFPGFSMTLEDYFIKNFDPGVIALFRDIVGLTEQQMVEEQAYWKAYVKQHVPRAYDGIREILQKQRAGGGIFCVVSHSYSENILRDYAANDLPVPDAVYGWELPNEKRKPAPYCVYDIMERFKLAPQEILVLDDLKPGYDMAKAAGVDFAAAGWAYDIPEIENFMRENCGLYFKTVKELDSYLFS